MKRTIPWGVILVTVVAEAGLCLLCFPFYRSRSPSSGALSAVYGIMDYALEEASKNTDHCFRFADATAEQRENLHSEGFTQHRGSQDQ